MSKYKHAVHARDAHITTLRYVIAGCVLVIAGLWFGWKSAPRDLVIHNPPDLRSGSTRAWWEIDPSNVYAFTFYVFQQINSWQKDGETDYAANIHAFSSYLTPSCKVFLEEDYEKRNRLGELRHRERGIREITGRGYMSTFINPITKQQEARVIVHSKNNWTVTLDLSIDEYVKGESVKRTFVRYPISVVRSDLNPELNPWGLAINCYTRTPERLAAQSEKG